MVRNISAKFELRSDIATTWASVNPTLREGEPGFESDTRRLKIGDGVTRWNNLPYFYTVHVGDTPPADTNSLWLDTN